MSKYFTLLPVMWFARINRVQLTASSLLNYHFPASREMEMRPPSDDLRAIVRKSTVVSFPLAFSNFLRFFTRRHKRPANSLRQPGRQGN
ncbi:hypothetical protein DTS49_18445 [Salmonella enterica]|nr:hypothetical protein [Salmonella enterica subsp. enterica serovar Paratyphi B]EAO7739925.1 hypothetical protein [Salmonella enterica]EAU2233164.1 hypothetical protein [Salmonella enterica]EBJ3790058.1 hypothetical protein [Salmonella enterica]EBK3209659.1 hypothetical protein [Salmonella enterica]